METEQNDMYVTSGLAAVRFNIVKKESDLDDESADFPPDLCHQVFSETENIFGYTNLKIRISYTAALMNCFVDIKYDTKLAKEKHNLKPDNVIELMEEWLPEGYTTSKAKFLELLSKENPSTVFGETLDTIVSEIKGRKRTFVINHCNLDEPGFKEFHARFETWIVWFIDAASYIDITDPRWMFYMMYEKCEKPTGTGVGYSYYPIGYCTLYKYYAFPEHVRPRISQFIILPPFQNAGLGTFMLKTVYEFIWKMPLVKDITVEDPSENFQKLRDYLDASYVQKELPAYSDNNIVEGFKASMTEEANRRFKINSKQARRIYEILKYARVKKSGKGLGEYKAELLHRVEAPLRKHEAKLKRLAKVCKTAELNFDIRHKQTETIIEQLIESYEPVVTRLLKENE